MIAAQPNDAAGLGLGENAPSELDWQAFSAAYFPGSRRHDLKAIVAYGAYRRSPPADAQQASGTVRLEPVAISSEAVSVEAWEDEGGSSLRVHPRETQHSA